jgi:sialic acid synthase SpsE
MLEIQHGKSVNVIAEAGCNHYGDIEKCMEFIYVAHECGADTVKFQAYKTENLINPREIRNFCYQSELCKADMILLKKASEDLGIEFLMSAFCIDSLRTLAAIGMETIKVPSGQIFNEEYLEFLGKMKIKVLLSTGMSTIERVVNAVRILVENGTPKCDITLLQCTTAYPAPIESANLSVLGTYKLMFPECSVGFSDHTTGKEAAIAATILGAEVIEKHIALMKDSTPDASVSMLPNEFKDMVDSIRRAEKVLGSWKKAPQACEEAMFHRQDIRKIGEQHERRTGN